MTIADYGPLAQPEDYPPGHDMRLKDRVAIVTGSTSGIGRTTAELFVREGAKVLFTGRNEKEGDAIIAFLSDGSSTGSGGEASFVAADISRSNEVQMAVQAAVDRWGRIDILVNNAAMMTFDPIAELSEEDWDKVFAVNLKGPFLFTKFTLPHMQEHAAIVNVSSVHAVATTPAVVPCAASKGGIEASTRGLAVELRDRGIRVNAVRLGAVDTPMLWENPNVKSGREKIDPADVGKSEQIAEAILYLCSEAAAFTNGSVLNVDGGRLGRLS